MPTTNFKSNQLRDGINNALRRDKALEAAYRSTTIGQLVSTRARTHSSTTAIDIFERGERATYREMDRSSNRYAHALRTFGVRKGDRVAVMLPNRIEMPTLWFALAKLGAVAVPIDMDYTPREIEYIVSDSQSKFAVVDESAWPVFCTMDHWPQELARERIILVGQSSNETLVGLHRISRDIDESPAGEDVQPGDLLTIQYTSGTTGFPKGCMLTHDYWGVLSCVLTYLTPYKRYLSWASSGHMFSPLILLNSYGQGGTLYVAQQFDPSQFIDWIEKHLIEWCALPRQIAEGDHDIPGCLRNVWQYDGWSAETVRRFREQLGVRSNYAWGMTEIGCGTQMPQDIQEMNDAGSVGISAPFRELRLINGDGSPTAVGEVGEVWVRGRGIFKGYWNKPEVNEDSFNGQWFKTGDLMRCNELGLYWFVGRKKDIIRRIADNISAREVEAIIREIPEIADVAAVPLRDQKRGEEVKVYVELKEGLTPAQFQVERILEHAQARLAVFKVPRYIAFIPKLPRTVTSNKVLKRELMAVSDPLSNTYDAEQKRWT
ncbi:class I adenylate-forming enzyme family protein [Bradyrhizobium sp. STM 3566]|uniref:class I adenylate-forming enzyme family protein n=1 Tax=Bradyrhizobium sp. STM 3566 TaxID=578928 RepID=UPI00388F218D